MVPNYFSLRIKKKEDKPKLIHISTDEVYGDMKNNEIDENYKYEPSSFILHPRQAQIDKEYKNL